MEPLAYSSSEQYADPTLEDVVGYVFLFLTHPSVAGDRPGTSSYRGERFRNYLLLEQSLLPCSLCDV